MFIFIRNGKYIFLNKINYKVMLEISNIIIKDIKTLLSHHMSSHLEIMVIIPIFNL